MSDIPQNLYEPGDLVRTLKNYSTHSNVFTPGDGETEYKHAVWLNMPASTQALVVDKRYSEWRGCWEYLILAGEMVIMYEEHNLERLDITEEDADNGI